MEFSEYKHIKRITPFGENFFFGYYDIPAFSASDKHHLCHNPKFIDRLQTKDDSCDIGVINLATNKYRKIDKTYAWNFQQGAMLQWDPLNPENQIIYNSVRNDKFCTIKRNIKKDNFKVLPLPVANVAKSGKFAVSINFSRLYDFRPGYGYACIKDPYFEELTPDNDGVFLMDMISGEYDLILSLKEIATFLKDTSKFYKDKEKLLINHITINPGGNRIVLLVRNFKTDKNTAWKTFVITCDISGDNLSLVNKNNTLASHYFWKDDENILFFTGGPIGNNLYLIQDKTDIHTPVNPEYFYFDGHCSYSKNKELILYDSYPQNNMRKLFLYNVKKDLFITIGAFYSNPDITGDYRCDLHPVWSNTNKYISIDSIHEGFRGIYIFE